MGYVIFNTYIDKGLLYRTYKELQTDTKKTNDLIKVGQKLEQTLKRLKE